MQPPAEFARNLAQIDRWDVPLRAAAVVTPTEVITHGACDTVTRIASVTKLLVSYAVLIAVEEATLSLDQPAGPPGSTIRHLLSHASGLPFDSPNSVAAPRTRRIYSNSGFEALGTVLAEAAGMTCAEYLSVGVFEPLGMTDSSLVGSPAKDVYSTVSDLARFARELLRPTLVSHDTFANAVRPQFAELAGVLPEYGTQTPCPWGLGFEVRGNKQPHWTGTTNSPATFGHYGGTGSFLWVDPQRELSLICLTGREFGDWAKPRFTRLSDDVLHIW